VEAHNVYLASIDPRIDDSTEDPTRPQPEGEFILVQLGETPEQTTKIGSKLDPITQQRLIKLIQCNKDLFAWIVANMLGMDPDFCLHHLNIYSRMKPIAQKNAG